MNRRGFLKAVGAMVAATVVGVPRLGEGTEPWIVVIKHRAVGATTFFDSTPHDGPNLFYDLWGRLLYDRGRWELVE